MSKYYLAIYRDGYTGGLQMLVENQNGSGTRIAGPKFNGTSIFIAEREITKEQAKEWESFLISAEEVKLTIDAILRRKEAQP